MGIWSSILSRVTDFYRRWKPEIQIYGIGLLLTFSGLSTGKDKAAGIVFIGMILYDLMRRYGEPWRAIGEKEYARRAQQRQQWWREQTEDVLGVLIVKKESSQAQPGAEPAPPPLRIIAAPGAEQDEPPESPSAPMAEPAAPKATLPPTVTHET